MDVNQNKLGRRYLKTRTRNWAQKLAKIVSGYNITPNQISILSVVFSLFAAISLYNSQWLLALFFIQSRLFCNMLDGLVAIEGCKQTILGDIYNDLPDRISDVMIITSFGFFSHLAWLAACLALFSAYIRVLYTSLGAPADYRGPMAKQHRMALISFICLVNFILSQFLTDKNIMLLIINSSIIILNLGLVLTLYLRVAHGSNYLLCHHK